MYKTDEKVLILNGSDADGGIGDSMKAKIEEIFNLANVEEIKLRELDIKPCVSCFNCWVKTPGKCLIDQYADEIVQKILACDRMIWVTDIVFGTYCFTTKKMMDRLIQVGLPFFKTVKGETRHYERYDKYPSLMIVGIQCDDNSVDRKLFRKLVARNRLNYTYHDDGLHIVKAEDKDAFDKIFGVAAQKEGA